MCKVTVYGCSIVELPKIENRAGNITPIHGNVNVPFDIPEGEAEVLMLIRHVLSF